MDKHFCRGKEVHTGDWIYGYYVAMPFGFNNDELIHVIFNPDECEHVCTGEYKDYGWYEVDPDTICRCTGVDDKNGIIIFENDIVSVKYSSNGEYFDSIVNFYNGSFRVQCIGYQINLTISLVKDIKIVGNKFDNPELLEAQNED